MLISKARYLIDKGKRTALYEISQTYKHASLKKSYKNIRFLAHHTHTHTHTHTRGRARAHAHTHTHTNMREGREKNTQERRQNLKPIVLVLFVEVSL